jgi:outer membrane protein TolC
LDLVGQRAISKSENTQSPRSNYLSTQIGVQLNVPLFAGGAVSSAVRQALANRDRERFVLEQVRKDLMLKVEREFNTLTEGGDRLAAARQSLHSARQLVVSVGKGIQAGTRTVIDRTHAMQRQAEALRELALVQYQLQLARLRLAALSGTGLTEAVEEVNRQLAAQP